LPGGKEAIEDLKSAGLDLDDVAAELSGKKGKKKKGKSSTAGSPQTSLSSQNLPGSFPPTPSPSNASPAMAQTDGLFEPSPSAPSKGKKKKNKKNKQKSTVIDVQAPLPPGFTPSTPPSEPIWKPATQPNKATTTPISTPDASFDPKETLLHLAAGHGQMELYSWLLDHGAVPEERNSAGFTAFHLALTYNHVELVEHSLSDLKPTFPKPVGSDMPDPYYPLPKNHTFLSLALIGGGKNPAKVLELVRIVLPFVGGRDVSKAWKKAEFEQGRKFLKDWKWESWEEIKWIMAERMQKLDFDGVSNFHFRKFPETCSSFASVRSSSLPKSTKVVDLASSDLTISLDSSTPKLHHFARLPYRLKPTIVSPIPQQVSLRTVPTFDCPPLTVCDDLYLLFLAKFITPDFVLIPFLTDYTFSQHSQALPLSTHVLPLVLVP